jgi:hypothetical protein
MSRRLIAVVGVTLAVLVAGCGSSGHQAAPKSRNSNPSVSSLTSSPDSSPTSTDPTGAATMTSPGGQKAAVLDAYQASWNDYLAVATHFPVNPLDPRLAHHMSGKELVFIQTQLTRAELQGQYLRGTVDTSHAYVKGISGTDAVVVDCDLDQTAVWNGKTNQVATPAGTGRTLINARVDLVNGVWKVTDQSTVSEGCTP